MSSHRLTVAVLATASAVVAGLLAATSAAAAAPHTASHSHSGLFAGAHVSAHRGRSGPAHYGAATITPLVNQLDQPKKISLTPQGNLLVALSGNGASPASCTDGTQASCLNRSGAIVEVTPAGHVHTVLGKLPSVSGGGDMGEATGPAQARWVNGQLQVLFQTTHIDPTTGKQPYGPRGNLLGDLVRFGRHGVTIEAKFGPFEARNNPDRGEGTGVALGQDSPIDSDPYGFVPYRGGYAVADAAGDDVLWVSPSGHISVLAVLPTITETAPPGSLGPTQTTPVPVQAQPVPDAITVGPDGALYVGELSGFPFQVGRSSVYRIVPGHAPQLYATGFTAIGDLAFDRHGHLIVLEIDQAGLLDPALDGGGLPTPGALIEVGAGGHGRTTLVGTGLEFPTGLAIARDGSMYVSNFGVVSATGGPGGVSGGIVHVTFARSHR